MLRTQMWNLIGALRRVLPSQQPRIKFSIVDMGQMIPIPVRRGDAIGAGCILSYVHH